MKKKYSFKGHKSDLSGVLALPKDMPKAYVLFAHCFTCGKNFTASSRISREMVKLGYAVFRFDYTGLGESEGDFSETNFTTNVADLIAAAGFMRDNFQAPQLLIGHSLGGTAILKAASAIAESKAVVCLSSPAHTEHIVHLFSSSLARINSKGQATVKLAGRDFTIKKQFIEDLNNQNTVHIRKLNKALLVMHSPKDGVVDIEEAEKIYTKAQHPKSFVSLDDADHLLSRNSDIQYLTKIIDAWVQKFIKS